MGNLYSCRYEILKSKVLFFVTEQKDSNQNNFAMGNDAGVGENGAKIVQRRFQWNTVKYVIGTIIVWRTFTEFAE